MEVLYFCVYILLVSVHVDAETDFDPDVKKLQGRPEIVDLKKNNTRLSGRTSKRKCGSTYQVALTQPIKVELGNRDCAWDFLGTKDCITEITCSKLDLKNCATDYLLIADGLGGEQKYCAANSNLQKGARSTNDASDLYMQLKAKTGSIKCEIKCGGKADVLHHAGLNRKEENQCICGMVPGNGNRIVGGETAKKFEFPWQVAIVFTGTRQPTCGGSIINDRYILTASHCFWFSKTEPDEIEVLVHAYQLDPTLQEGWRNVKLGERGSVQGPGWELKEKTDKDEGTQRFKVAEIILHPLFSDSYDFDVALLRIQGKIDLKSNPEVGPICLPPAGKYSSHEGKTLTVIGWGLPHQDAGATVKPLQKLDIPVISLEDCEKMMDMKLTSRMLCAGFKKGVRDACLGDSGGPLFERPEKAGGPHIQRGIVSWGEGCAREDRPGVYTNLQDVVQWVNYQIKESTWCRSNI